MGLTRTNLEDRCLQYGYGEGDRTRFQDFLNQTYRDVLARHRWSWNRATTSLSLTAGNNSVSLPAANYIFFGRLRPTTLEVNPPDFVEWDTTEWKEFMRVAPDSTVRGTPSKYSIYQDNVFFDVYADRTYGYDAYVWTLPTYMTTGASEAVLPDEDREVLVYGALMHQLLRDKDYQGAQYWNQLYEGRLKEMWQKDRVNNSETALTVPMPRHYYGAFSR